MSHLIDPELVARATARALNEIELAPPELAAIVRSHAAAGASPAEATRAVRLKMVDTFRRAYAETAAAIRAGELDGPATTAEMREWLAAQFEAQPIPEVS